MGADERIDKAAADKKQEATKKFQGIALAYAVLCEPSRRAFYDRTGSTSESLRHSSGDDDFDWMAFYRSQFHEVVSEDAIDKFAASYKNSEEEKQDILDAYTEGEGDMDHVYETVILSDVVTEDERFRQIINKAIEDREVDAFTKYTKETLKSKKRRLKLAQEEANEAMEYAAELGVRDKLFGDKKGETRKQGPGENGGDEAALAALITGRQAERKGQAEDFLANLEAKYGGGAKTGRGKKKKVDVDVDVDEEEVDVKPPIGNVKKTLKRKERKEKAKQRTLEEREGQLDDDFIVDDDDVPAEEDSGEMSEKAFQAASKKFIERKKQKKEERKREADVELEDKLEEKQWNVKKRKL